MVDDKVFEDKDHDLSYRFKGSTTKNNSEKFKILIASDVHLGYLEKNSIRGDDSFNAFEELLQSAVKHDVDLILLAGDLFHINKPSLSTIQRASELIRKYTFGL